MRIEEISNVEALGGAGIIAVLAYAVYLFVPGERRAPMKRRFATDDITAYDRALPKYFVTALVALTVAGIHATLKSLPLAYRWLGDAGHGGHLVRDIANTHLMIVVGGTVAATGLTWYVLPRVLGRPLVNEKLAGASFWCTVIGAGGFYVTNVVVGLVAGAMEHGGMSWADAETQLGAWKAVPVGLSATVMGIGYWTFVAEVILTVRASREVADPPPDRHLAKYFIVGALGLFVGTVQGVIQVMPAQERWLHLAAPAGEYIDPIAHAHVNLVTGTLTLLAGIVFWWTRDHVLASRQRAAEQRLFWVLVPGSVSFYVAFMTLGFVEGSMIVNEGLSFEAAVGRLGAAHIVPLAVAGGATLAGLWAWIALVTQRIAGRVRGSATTGLLAAGLVALTIGTTQGALQLVPGVKDWMETTGPYGDAVANAHAQLNMLGGVMLTLVGLVLARSKTLVGRSAPARLATAALRWSVPGIALYYLAAMVTAVTAGRALHSGSVPATGPVHQVIGPLGMAIGSALATIGFGTAAWWAWGVTADLRRQGWHRFRASASAYDGGRTRWVGHVPWPVFVGAEAVGAAAGFPGWGWILSGRALVGLPLALVGPSIAWGIIPVTMTGDGTGPVGTFPVAYLVWSAGLSTALLTATLSISTRRVLRARVTA